MTRIPGMDPCLRVTGFGVIEKEGSRLRYVASGCIQSKDKETLPRRVATLLKGISEVVASYRPDEAAVEIVFVKVNPQSTLRLGQDRGALGPGARRAAGGGIHRLAGAGQNADCIGVF